MSIHVGLFDCLILDPMPERVAINIYDFNI